MKFVITINMSNDAFQDGGNGTEVARILEDLASETRYEELDSIGVWCTLRDINGNTVGKAQVKKGSADE